MRRSLWALVLLMAVAMAIVATRASAFTNLMAGAEPLSPLEAFVPTVAQVTDKAIVVQFAISEDYYLYRDKTYFSLNKDGGQTQGPEPQLSATVLHSKALTVTDDFFGEMAIYRNQAQFTLPYTGKASATDGYELAVKFQGCADIGLCYPPTTVTLPVEFAAVSQPDKPASLTQPLSNFSSRDTSQTRDRASPVADSAQPRDVFGDSFGNDLLPPDLAYLPQIVSATADKIALHWTIEPGYYLYRDKFSFSLNGAEAARITGTASDPGLDQVDEFFGAVKVFRDAATIELALAAPATVVNQPGISLDVQYQGCADIGVCFPPTTVTLPVLFSAPSDTPSATALSTVGTSAGSDGGQSSQPKSGPLQSEQDRLFTLLGSNGLWLNVATFFGLGLLLAFTPCVLPMVPILSSLIVGQGEKMSTARAFQLSLVYVLVMASTYALVGVLVGLSGYNVQAFLQNPWVLSGIAVLFVLLSLSMFGFYELQMPVALQTRLTQWSNRQGGGQLSGVAAMGFISTLIVGPCVTAPLAGALIYIAKTGDALIGGSALFALGLGMGAPLLLIGTSAGRLVPRAGAWMNVTKHIFGIIMLGMAIYMISRFLPATITMVLYGILIVMSGIYLGATDTLTRDSSGWQRFGKGLGVVASVYGLALLIGALSGSTSYSAPLRNMLGSSAPSGAQEAEHGLAFTPIKGLDGLQMAVDQARAEGRPVMLDFYADWCISCKEMEAFTFTDESVQAKLRNTLLIQADVTANDAADQALLKAFDLFGPPGIIFYDSNGREIPAARIVGFMPADEFNTHLDTIL